MFHTFIYRISILFQTFSILSHIKSWLFLGVNMRSRNRKKKPWIFRPRPLAPWRCWQQPHLSCCQGRSHLLAKVWDIEPHEWLIYMVFMQVKILFVPWIQWDCRIAFWEVIFFGVFGSLERSWKTVVKLWERPKAHLRGKHVWDNS